MIDNQYYHYYYIYFKLYLLIYFLSDYCNVLFLTIKNDKNLL